MVPDVTNALIPLATLAKQLAENAETSFDDAALATEVILALQHRGPVSAEEPDAAGTAERAATIAMLLDASRLDPARRERMTGLLVRQAVLVSVVALWHPLDHLQTLVRLHCAKAAG